MGRPIKRQFLDFSIPSTTQDTGLKKKKKKKLERKQVK